MSNPKKVPLKRFYKEMIGIVDEFKKISLSAMDDGLQDTADEAKEYLKQGNITPTDNVTHIRRDGKNKEPYRTTYKVYKPAEKTRKRTNWRVIGNSDYRLDHLLENGHIVRNSYSGKDGRPNNYPVKHRGNYGSFPKAKVKDDKHTTSFNMWDGAYDLTEKVILKNIEKAIKKKLKKGGQ